MRLYGFLLGNEYGTDVRLVVMTGMIFAVGEEGWLLVVQYWSALATAPAETSAQAKESFNIV